MLEINNNQPAKKTCASTKWLAFELNSTCNMNCRWCNLDHRKKKTEMSLETFKKSISNIINNDFFQLERIDLYNSGEVLLNKNIVEILNYLGVIKNKYPLPQIDLLTNGLLLDKNISQKILDSAALDEIWFSFDGGSEEQYQYIRRNNHYHKVKSNIENFFKLNSIHKNPIKTKIITIVAPNKNLSTEWMSQDFQDLIKMTDIFSMRHPHNWDGTKNLGLNVSIKKNKQVCKFLNKNLIVLPNGDINICCANLNAKGIIGNIHKQSLWEIYNSYYRKFLIHLHKQGKMHQSYLCQNCQGYYEK